MMKNTLIYYLLLLFLPPFTSYGQFNTIGGAKLTQPKMEDSCSYITGIPEVSDSTPVNRPVTKNNAYSLPLRKVLITSPRGTRIHPVNGKYAMHNGIDLRASYDSVFAIMDGLIDDFGYDSVSGLWIRILHPGNIKSKYAHLSIIAVQSGELINSGQYIGMSGNTGMTTGTHLHFQIESYICK